WSISKCVKSRSLSLCCGPASSTSTSSPRAASSLATTAPPAPDPITMMSRICLPPVPEIALELVAAVRDARVVGKIPADWPAGDRARGGGEHRGLSVGKEADHERQSAGQRRRRRVALERGEHPGLVREREVREW